MAAQLNAGAANIESTLSQLAGQVAPLQSEWQGVAQARFQELWAEWQRSSRGIQEALHGISQLTQQAGANYERHRAGDRLQLRPVGDHHVPLVGDAIAPIGLPAAGERAQDGGGIRARRRHGSCEDPFQQRRLIGVLVRPLDVE